MNGYGKVISAVLILYGVVMGFLFTQLNGKADASAMATLQQDVREIRALAQQILREIPRDRGGR